jgi:major membrane immunogen (membrane-anchored lipoprotein)
MRRNYAILRLMLSGLRCTVVLVLCLLLAACGGSDVTKTAQTEHYSVQLTLDGLEFGQRQATVELRDAAGNPADAGVVVIAPVMRQMGMASPEAAAQKIAPGRYQASGEFFSMIGTWEIDVRIDNSGSEEVATFTFDIVQ